MNVRSSILIQFGPFLVASVYSAWTSVHLPDVVPTHWDAAGHVDAYGSKWMNLCLMPGTILFILLLTYVLPKLSPKQFQVEPFEATYSYVMVLVSALMLALHIVILRATASASVDFGQSFMAIMFGFFALIGNVLGRVGRNFWMGIRTPWTLADDRVWHATHRYAGRLWVGGGILGVIACLLGVPLWVSITFLMVIALLPVVRSYFLYRAMNPQGSG